MVYRHGSVNDTVESQVNLATNFYTTNGRLYNRSLRNTRLSLFQRLMCTSRRVPQKDVRRPTAHTRRVHHYDQHHRSRFVHHVLITDTHQMFQTAGEFGVVFRNWKDVHNLVAVKTLKGENFIHTSSVCQWRLLIV